MTSKQKQLEEVRARLKQESADATRVSSRRALASEEHKAKGDKLEENAQRFYSKGDNLSGKFAQALSAMDREKQKAASDEEIATMKREMSSIHKRRK